MGWYFERILNAVQNSFKIIQKPFKIQIYNYIFNKVFVRNHKNFIILNNIEQILNNFEYFVKNCLTINSKCL